MPDREYFNSRRHNRRQQFIDLLGGKCERCGSKKNLHFDHKNPARKEFRIADRLDAPEGVLKKEVRKCRLLCDKCHRDKTREKDEHGQPKARHGTIWYYKKYKCRCDKCRDAMSEYNKNKTAQISHIVQKFYVFASVIDDLTTHKIYKSFREKTVAGYNGDPFGDSVREYLPDLSKEEMIDTLKSISPRILYKELKQKEPHPFVITDAFMYLSPADQLAALDRVPDSSWFTLMESIPYSYENNAAVLRKFYERAIDYFWDEGHDRLARFLQNEENILNDTFGKDYDGPVEDWYKIRKPQQAIRESDNRLVEISESGEIEPVPAEVIDFPKEKYVEYVVCPECQGTGMNFDDEDCETCDTIGSIKQEINEFDQTV